ncbi:MAG: 50S ribosomal protein L21 [Candidatus Sumerlaeia bacterium]
MYAVIRSGDKQYKVEKGERLRVPSMEAEAGQEVDFDVLAFHDGENLTIGTPVVENATVKGKVVKHGRGRKMVVYRFRRRKGQHRKKGHRQGFTEIVIEDIQA